MEKQKVSVYVAGREFTLASSDSPAYIQRVASYADRTLRETAMATRLPTEKAYVMAAISLSDEVLKSQDENARLRRRVRELEETLYERGNSDGESGAGGQP